MLLQFIDSKTNLKIQALVQNVRNEDWLAPSQNIES
jgi:hypothetical protein